MVSEKALSSAQALKDALTAALKKIIGYCQLCAGHPGFAAEFTGAYGTAS
jgi:hypothetical protein